MSGDVCGGAVHALETKSCSPAVQLEVGSRTGGGLMAMHLANRPCSLAFVYGTLKQGFSNHWLMGDVVGEGHAHFVGVARTKQRYPLVCDPFQVPFLLHMPNSGLHVRGELYGVRNTRRTLPCSSLPIAIACVLCRNLIPDDVHLILRLIKLLDELECTAKGHYVRRPLILTGLQPLEVDCAPECEILAEAYFAHAALQRGLSSAPHIEAYTKKKRSTTFTEKTDLRTERFWSMSITGSTRRALCPTSVCKPFRNTNLLSLCAVALWSLSRANPKNDAYIAGDGRVCQAFELHLAWLCSTSAALELNRV